MTIAAIYIKDYYLFDSSYLANLGGEYLYSIKEGRKEFFITREKNENFINNFFDATGCLTNISAIVGENGVGKTSSLVEIIEMIKKRRNGLVIIEDSSKTYLYPSKRDVSHFVNPKRKNEKYTRAYELFRKGTWEERSNN